MSIINSPKVSVVLALHKLSPFLDGALTSLLNQTLDNIEIIIVANGCSSETLEKLEEIVSLKQDRRIRIIRAELGQHAFSLNMGILHSKSEFVARMDYDDLSLPDRLEAQYEYMQHNPEIVVLGTAFNYINEQGQFLKKRNVITSDRWIRFLLPFCNPFCHPSVMVRKSALLSIASYSGGLFSEDYSLWLRISREKNFKMANLHDVHLSYRLSTNQSRGMLLSYAEVAGLLWTEFLYSKKIRYFFGCLLASFKIFFARK